MNTHLKANRHPMSKHLQDELTPQDDILSYLGGFRFMKHKVQSLIFSVVLV